LSLSRVELFARIRRDRRSDPQVSVRTLADRYQVHRRTVREALAAAVPKERKKPPPRRSVLEPAHGWIDAMLREDLTSPRKQKHTTSRIHQADSSLEKLSPQTQNPRDHPLRRRPISGPDLQKYRYTVAAARH
jgi:hypothetical protein